MDEETKDQVHASTTRLRIPVEDDSSSYSESSVTFDRAGLVEHYKPIGKYEGAHRYDPAFEWEPKEETRVVRKVLFASAPNCYLAGATREMVLTQEP